jgi:hypothetical protein
VKVYTISIRTMDTAEPLCVFYDREKAQRVANGYKKYCDELLSARRLNILSGGIAWVCVDEIEMFDDDEAFVFCGRKILAGNPDDPTSSTGG